MSECLHLSLYLKLIRIFHPTPDPIFLTSCARSLHRLSQRLSETPALVQGPPPAATLIEHNELSSYIKAKWNQEVGNLAAGFRDLDRRAMVWTRGLLYGGDKLTTRAEVSEKSGSS